MINVVHNCLLLLPSENGQSVLLFIGPLPGTVINPVLQRLGSFSCKVHREISDERRPMITLKKRTLDFG